MQNKEVNKKEKKRRIFRRWWIIPGTILVLTAVFAIRCGILLSQYPEQEISLETICGPEDSNLSGMDRNGSTFRAQTTSSWIVFSFANAVPVRSIEYDIAKVSRDNCRSYINLDGSGQQSSVIMAVGKNYVEFAEADPVILSDGLSMLPVTVRGVSFQLTSFIINPHAHLVSLELRNYLILLAVLLLFETILFELLAERNPASAAAGSEQTAGVRRRLSIPAFAILVSLQGFVCALFLYQFSTEDWSELQVIYHVLVLLSSGLILLMLHLPVSVNRSIRPELPPVRIFLFSLFSFAVMELLYSDMYHLDHADSTILNLLIYAVPYMALYAAFGRKKRHYSYLISMVWWLVVAMINHYYFEYRQQAFELADLSMAGTARNVMGTYRLDISADVLFVYAASALLIAGLLTEDHDSLPDKPAWKRGTAGAAAILSAVVVVCNLPYVNLWNTNIGTMHRGYVLSYLSFAKKHLEKPTPEGYSAKEAESILAPYELQNGQQEQSEDADSSNDTDIIVIMDEAFADLPSVYGFETSTDGLPYIHSLEGSNVRKGWLMSSVFGGTTANTEYEFLTGNSTAFLGAGSVPYTQYINSEQESLAWLLKNRGYSATAFHPFLASGYKRYKVYPLLGFDEFISSDDGLAFNTRIRTYISDSADYQNLEKIYEDQAQAAPDEPQFIFNVTMQNHGTYSTEVPAVDVTVEPVDDDLKELVQLREYLSLAYQSDKAFEELTDYYSKVSRRTVILMFGDHQPGVNNDVLRAMNPAMFEEGADLEEKEKQYTVPYVLWANFDLPSTLPAPDRISPNYLRSFLLQAAGIQGSAYDRFAASVREQYPALNILGWYDADGNVHDIDSLDGETQLSNYKKVAYYNLFDHGRVNRDLFD